MDAVTVEARVREAPGLGLGELDVCVSAVDCRGILDDERKRKVLFLETKGINQFRSNCAQALSARNEEGLD